MGISIDKITKSLLWFSAILIMILGGSIFISLFLGSKPAISKFGLSFISHSQWDPVNQQFGILSFIIGSFTTSIISLLISLPFSFSVALLLTVYIKEGILHNIISHATDLLAGIPSVIYGFWGLFFLIPIIRNIEIKLGVTPYGVGIFTASIVLSIMIIPYSSSVIREVIAMIPSEIIEAGFALGGARYDIIKKIILPYASSGIIAGIFFAFARAFGETMAVTMVIGNSNILPKSIFAPGNTMPSLIANEFTEATTNLHISSLIYVALWLFIFNFIINILTNFIISKYYRRQPLWR